MTGCQERNRDIVSGSLEWKTMCNVRVAEDIYGSCKTVMRCAVRMTEEFKEELGRHQRSAEGS